MNCTTPLIPTDYISGFPNGNVIDWGSSSILDIVEVQTVLKTAVQSKIGSSRFKLRLQFPGSNNDGISDFVRFTNPSLIITYTAP